MANNTPRAPSHLESTEIKDEIKTLKEKENNIVINIKDIIKSDDELIAAYDNIKSIIGIGEESVKNSVSATISNIFLQL